MHPHCRCPDFILISLLDRTSLRALLNYFAVPRIQRLYQDGNLNVYFYWFLLILILIVIEDGIQNYVSLKDLFFIH